MRCPFCQNEDSQVKDSRPTEDGGAIRRRRHCTVCGGRFTTFERVQLREILVVKKSGKREPFERDKLERSVAIACRKRPIAPDRIERLVTGVVRRLESLGEAEVEADAIGEMVMEALQALDPVAYIRFASVYREFREAKDFEIFVGALARSVDARPADDRPVDARPVDARPVDERLLDERPMDDRSVDARPVNGHVAPEQRPRREPSRGRAAAPARPREEEEPLLPLPRQGGDWT